MRMKNRFATALFPVATLLCFSPCHAETGAEGKAVIVIGPRNEVIVGTEAEMKEKRLAAGHFEKAQGLFREGSYVQAAKEYETAARHEPASADIFNNLGAAYSYAGDSERALAAYRRALEIDPRHEAARSNMTAMKQGLRPLKKAA
jgi:Flp pilus assembly protein TadD